MRAVVLVGGFGTRLRPLTLHRPKQMLPVVDRPMIEWVVAHLVAHGVDEVVLSLGYRPDAFVDAYPDGVCGGARLTYAVEDEPLDTAGAIRFAARTAGVDERFVVVNGDNITDLDLTALVRFHEAHGGQATIALHHVEDPSRYGVVLTDRDGRVLAFVEKPAAGTAPSHFVNAGTYVLEPEVLDSIPDGRKVSIERETFPLLVERGSLYAMPDGDAYWIDAGTPETYLQVQLDLVDGREVVGAAPPVVVDPTATIAAGATVQRSVVGAGAQIEDGAEVVESVVSAGARVGAHASVRRSIVGPRAIVRPDAKLDDLTIVGEGEVVP